MGTQSNADSGSVELRRSGGSEEYRFGNATGSSTSIISYEIFLFAALNAHSRFYGTFFLPRVLSLINKIIRYTEVTFTTRTPRTVKMRARVNFADVIHLRCAPRITRWRIIFYRGLRQRPKLFSSSLSLVFFSSHVTMLMRVWRCSLLFDKFAHCSLALVSARINNTRTNIPSDGRRRCDEMMKEEKFILLIRRARKVEFPRTARCFSPDLLPGLVSFRSTSTCVRIGEFVFPAHTRAVFSRIALFIGNAPRFR